MEVLVVDRDFWRGRRVFLTGQTGFKGSWLAFWLRRLGAEVAGYALPPESDPSLHQLLGLDAGPDHIGDVRDAVLLRERLTAHRPEVVLHLAAQALVRASYDDPVGTFATNVMGTANVLDAVRACPEVRAVVVVTSDKCYENHEVARGYVEGDPLGGHDPYSASKGAAEIVTASMRSSFFSPSAVQAHPALIASVRAGNVIGGGDWSVDRLVPDIVRGCFGPDATITLRAPHAVRPWQHVLEPVSAYLALAQRLHGGDRTVAGAFNFGPAEADSREVIEIATALVAKLGGNIQVDPASAGGRHEAHLLRLDCTRAREELGWRPRLSFDDAVGWTADWYAGHARGMDLQEITAAQIDVFAERMELP